MWWLFMHTYTKSEATSQQSCLLSALPTKFRGVVNHEQMTSLSSCLIRMSWRFLSWFYFPSQEIKTFFHFPFFNHLSTKCSICHWSKMFPRLLFCLIHLHQTLPAETKKTIFYHSRQVQIHPTEKQAHSQTRMKWWGKTEQFCMCVPVS